MPFFTIVIPLYNKQNYIAATLQSILAQTYTDFEVIVVNDASTDESVAVAKTIEDKRIRIIEHPVNSGLSASRNTGIKNATSNHIALLDADDLWKPDFLSTIFRLITKYPNAGIFATQYEEVYPNSTIIVHDRQDIFTNKNADEGIVDYFKTGLAKAIYCCSCVCFDKKVFDAVGFYDEQISFAEDIDFNIRANYHFTLAYSKIPQAGYIMHTQNQITGTGLANKKIPDLNKYEHLADNRPNLKKYLDFYRYAFAKMYKLSGDKKNYRRLKNEITPANLNLKQRLLLASPLFIINAVSHFKNLLLKKGIVIDSY